MNVYIHDMVAGHQSLYIPVTGGKMTIMGYTIRWKQCGNDSETTGKRVYDSLDDVTAMCERINAKWNGEITQCPVEWELTRQGKKGQELANLKHLVGLE